MTENSREQIEIRPESASDLREFLGQFDDDRVFGITYRREEDDHPVYRIVTAIEKVRPAAVPIDQPTTFEMTVIEPVDDFEDELRLPITTIIHVKAADLETRPRRVRET